MCVLWEFCVYNYLKILTKTLVLYMCRMNNVQNMFMEKGVDIPQFVIIFATCIMQFLTPEMLRIEFVYENLCSNLGMGISKTKPLFQSLLQH